MKKIIIIKYGELSTKKDNKNFFISKLKNNIEVTLKNINHNTYYDFGRMFIETDDFDEVIKHLKNVFGIQELLVGYTSDNLEIDDINNKVLDLVSSKDFKTFKVVTKRSNKSYPINSMEISKVVGGYLLKNISDIKVDVHNPELTVNIEIRNEEVLFYFEGIKGLGGYPVGTLGKGLLMLSGGIDSPVAGYLSLKRGVDLECLYFESLPHTSLEAREKVLKLASILNEYSLNIKVHVVPFTNIQETIYKNAPDSYIITIMRRMMYRIADRYSKKIKCKVIINGESIGQVASQTLTSMVVINSVTNKPIIRPVACMDKLEIIDIANKINTYQTSILPYEDCCTIFLPKHPVINPELDKCIEIEKTFNYEELINETINNIQVINLNKVKNDLL